MKSTDPKPRLKTYESLTQTRSFQNIFEVFLVLLVSFLSFLNSMTYTITDPSNKPPASCPPFILLDPIWRLPHSQNVYHSIHFEGGHYLIERSYL